MEIKLIDIDKIDADGGNPRSTFQDIGELAASIEKDGLIEPLKLAQNGGRYKIIDGERRYRAIKLIQGWDHSFSNKIPCIVMNVGDPILTQLIIDIHKHKFDPIDEAKAIKSVLNRGMDVERLKVLTGKSVNYFLRRLRLLQFSPTTLQKIRENKIPSSAIDWMENIEDKELEEKIVRRVENEHAGRDKAMRIVREETSKFERLARTYKRILNNLIEKVNDFEEASRKYSKSITLDDLTGKICDEAINRLSKEIKRLDSLIEIRSNIHTLKNAIERIKKRYGEKMVITSELITSPSEQVEEADEEDIEDINEPEDNKISDEIINYIRDEASVGTSIETMCELVYDTFDGKQILPSEMQRILKENDIEIEDFDKVRIEIATESSQEKND